MLAIARVIYALFGLSALVVSGWAMVSPAGFWSYMGLSVGSDLVVATYYAGVFFAVGVMCLLGLGHPHRYSGILLFMGIYKSASFMALMARAAGLLGAPAGLPEAGWTLTFQYLAMAVICLWVYRGLASADNG